MVGDAACPFDPYDENAICDAMMRVLNDGELSAELVAKGYERVKLFENSTIVEKTRAAFERIKVQ